MLPFPQVSSVPILINRLINMILKTKGGLLVTKEESSKTDDLSSFFESSEEVTASPAFFEISM